MQGRLLPSKAHKLSSAVAQFNTECIEQSICMHILCFERDLTYAPRLIISRYYRDIFHPGIYMRRDLPFCHIDLKWEKLFSLLYL